MTATAVFPSGGRAWAIVLGCMIGVELLGFGASVLGGTTTDTDWYRALTLPAWQPPGWVFPVVWGLLYPLIGYAAARVWLAGGPDTTSALALWGAQLALNLIWSWLFFSAQLILPALLLLLAILAVAVLTTLRFGRITPVAAWAMVPYLVWGSYATVLNLRVWQLNPGA